MNFADSISLKLLIEILKKYSDQGLAAYNSALESAKNINIDYKNPVKLGLALNLSFFYYEIYRNKDEACKLAEDTLSKRKVSIKKYLSKLIILL